MAIPRHEMIFTKFGCGGETSGANSSSYWDFPNPINSNKNKKRKKKAKKK